MFRLILFDLRGSFTPESVTLSSSRPAQLHYAVSTKDQTSCPAIFLNTFTFQTREPIPRQLPNPTSVGNLPNHVWKQLLRILEKSIQHLFKHFSDTAQSLKGGGLRSGILHKGEPQIISDGDSGGSPRGYPTVRREGGISIVHKATGLEQKSKSLYALKSIESHVSAELWRKEVMLLKCLKHRYVAEVYATLFADRTKRWSIIIRDV